MSLKITPSFRHCKKQNIATKMCFFPTNITKLTPDLGLVIVLRLLIYLKILIDIG